MGKDSKDSKKQKKSEEKNEVKADGVDIDNFDTSKLLISPVAHPLATDKLHKKLLKLTKKAHKQKHVRRGVKDAVKAVRKGQKGLMVLAGNVFPEDIISHIPVLCEEANIPYCFVPSKELLGASTGTKRSTSVLFVSPGTTIPDEFEYKDVYDEAVSSIAKLN